MTTEMDKVIQEFISKTAKSKVAIIVPLYGYWADVKDNPLTAEVLKITMDRLGSSVHQLYVFFVGEGARIPSDVQNYIVVQSHAGNTAGVDVPSGATYGDYVRKGLEVAQSTTESAYFIVMNPWIFIQRIAIDVLVDRLNYADNAKIVCGYDLRPTLQPENFDPQEFQEYFIQTPKETRDFEINLFGMTRYTLEMIGQDPSVRSSKYLGCDYWQKLYSRGYDVITTQRVPIFVFDFNLMGIENPADVEADKNYFLSKWGFNPEV